MFVTQLFMQLQSYKFAQSLGNALTITMFNFMKLIRTVRPIKCHMLNQPLYKRSFNTIDVIEV